MNPVAAYQVAQSKQLVKKKMLSNPKMREKYIEEQRRKKEVGGTGDKTLSRLLV